MLARETHQTADGLYGHVVPGAFLIGAGLAVSGDRAIYYARANRLDMLISKTALVEITKFVICYQDIRFRGKHAYDLLPLRGFNTDADRALPTICRLEIGRVFGVFATFVFQVRGPQWRVSSPIPGRSIFQTSAPRSDRICVRQGPARIRDRSRIFIPVSGPAMFFTFSVFGQRRPALRRFTVISPIRATLRSKFDISRLEMQ